ncbi:universal stress protein [Paenarthrobacter sp. Z7-10]|uniref:universal stress protein n=1 Tax=Paenarthrobacter sp. Z7-10 TaxID=2787635 RepID=UPI0022A952BC|nr:universal stress protein [Paenarthrobacter sp. Z7-10]MCZ2404267.1 universal stress protein [Paenarthrobacter sp. Z7-10]
MTEPAQHGSKSVIVGVSPTSGSVTALRWGADEARRRSVPLFAVSAWRGPRLPITSGARPPIVTSDRDGEYAAAESELTAHVVAVLGAEQEVSCRVIEGSALKVLRKVSRQAALIVLDAPQRTDFSQTPRLAQRLVYQAECPVLVLPPAVSRPPDTAFVRGSKLLGRSVAKAVADAGRPELRFPRTEQPNLKD